MKYYIVLIISGIVSSTGGIFAIKKDSIKPKKN